MMRLLRLLHFLRFNWIAYHDEDSVDTSLSDGRCDELHHRSIAKVDMEISRSWNLQAIELLKRHDLMWIQCSIQVMVESEQCVH
jgi:hypothetical protein